ncbi:HNH endonuclease [Nocardia salmonicida]|uniref:HNH endonuclease n=1 Tax=Nocardia salmonicida TaxID=53431 RepID=UPI0033DB2311
MGNERGWESMGVSSLIEGRRAWLLMSKATYRRLGGASTYDDDAASHYSYDNYVANHLQVAEGDLVAVWDNKKLVGASVIELITSSPGTKRRGRCPQCNTTNIAARKTVQPVYRCDDCKHQFDVPVVEVVPATIYRMSYEQAWVDLPGALTGEQLRPMCVASTSQNSFRELDWEKFRVAVANEVAEETLEPVNATLEQIRGGHTIRPTRVRLGQSDFRKAQLAKYGDRCAFTGDLPRDVLEACHLYSYAKLGKHHRHGGILLRRDLHTLFDRGVIVVDEDGRIDLREDFRQYPVYSDMHGAGLTIQIDQKQRQWFQLHRTQHR